MSIVLQNRINELQDRVEKLERFMNKMNDEPRMVAGAPDPDPKPEPTPAQKKAATKRAANKKVEGDN